jgi:hypothetical protein
MNRGKIIFILFFILILISCKTAEFGFKVININGMVYDFSNRPIPHCEISLGRKHSTTDINGRFTIQKVAYGPYVISANKNGHEPYLEEIIIRDPGQIIYIRLPSQNQLLSLVDEALVINNFSLAEETVERAYQIDGNNPEMLFYYAAIKYRQREYNEAISFLNAAKNLGSRDLYIDKFLTLLKEKSNAVKNN